MAGCEKRCEKRDFQSSISVVMMDVSTLTKLGVSFQVLFVYM